MKVTCVFILELLETRTMASTSTSALLDHAFVFARSQLLADVASLKANQFPSYSTGVGPWKTVPASDWTSGFFAGCLWETDQHFGKKTLQKTAEQLTRGLDQEDTAGDDLAFRFLPTDGQMFAATGDPASKQILIDAAASKIKTFDKTVEMFRSVDGRTSTSGNAKANFSVLIDHTMDLELVYQAAKLANRPDWTAKANDHLAKLARTMVRADGSTVQWGYFDDKTGQFVDGETRQGLSNSSTWSRGQAWAITSFTAAAEATGRSDFLADARKTADYFIAHLPSDGVPYWDFNAPVTPTTPRDSSAAAVAADALLRLAKLLPGTDGATYFNAAVHILTSLASPAYLAGGTSSPGILLHGARYVPKDQSDGALIFGDYYFLDAINRYEAAP